MAKSCSTMSFNFPNIVRNILIKNATYEILSYINLTHLRTCINFIHVLFKIKRTILKIGLQSKESKYISTVSHNDMLYRIRCSELDFVPCRTDI